MNRPVLKLQTARRPRLKKCRAPDCVTEFEPKRIGQKTCSVKCAIAFMRVEQAEKNLRVIRAERQVWRAKNKPVSKLIAEAQKEFNRWILARDWNQGCISCDVGPGYDGQFSAGHYRTTAAAAHLRFNEDNTWRQCGQCNHHKSGNVVEYRIRLVAKIGRERVEALENDNRTVKWSRDELVEIRRKYLALWKEARAKRL